MNNILFSLSKKIDVLPPDTRLLIVPSKDRWNDFGFRVRVEVGVVVSDLREVVWLPAYLAIKDRDDTTVFIRELMKETAYISIKEISFPFASLLFDSQQYSTIRNLLGSEISKNTLLQLNDISLLHSRHKSIPDWPEFFDSTVFSQAFIRASESYFAYRRGADFLDSNEWFLDDVQQSFSVQLMGDGPKYEFDFNFDSSNKLRGRIAVIVGKNGFGKTESLRKLAGSFAGVETKQTRISNKINVNQVLAFGYGGQKKLRKRKVKNIQSAAVREFIFNPRMERTHHRDGFARLLVDIARVYDNEGRPLLNLYRDVLEKEMGQLKIYVPMKDDSDYDHEDTRGKRYLSFDKWIRFRGEQSRLHRLSEVDFSRNFIYLDEHKKARKLSTGQRAFLQFTLNALANAGPASIFLIDEPENFLHPNLISQFVNLLNRILKTTKSIAIVATHSPFVVREVHAEQVHVLCINHDDGSTIVLKPRLQTLGANVAAISSEVFGDDLPEHLMQELINSVDKQVSFDMVLEKYGHEMSIEALMNIRLRGYS